MQKFLPYNLLLVGMLLLQTIVFDRLMISHLLTPLVYIAFFVLLPMQTRQLHMLLWGFTVGILADLTMGFAGLNTIIAVFIAYSRITILSLCLGSKKLALGGSPTPERVGNAAYARYSATMILLFHLLFFWLESLSLLDLEFFAKRLLFSSMISFVVIWLIATLFGAQLKRK